MVTFRNNSNNNRRSNFRNNNRRTSFRRNDEGSKFKSNFSSNNNFQRKSPGRNNHNAPKLIEKYNDLAREALANEDKILSENYFQHADHFTRILAEQEVHRESKSENNFNKDKISETNKTNLETEAEIDKSSDKQVSSATNS